MPHQVNTLFKLGRKPGYRQATVRSMVISLLRYERIQTTPTRAKVCRRFAERMISLAKQPSVVARRRAKAWLQDRELVRLLFHEIGPRYQAVNGGYTRIIPLASVREGDGAPLVLLELTHQRPKEAAKPSQKKKAKEVKPKAKVKEEVPRPEAPRAPKALESRRPGWLQTIKRIFGKRAPDAR